MGFQGKFRDLSLVDILQVVQMTQKSGVLKIVEGAKRASIIFKEGNIVDAHPSGSGRLTDDLVRGGLVTKVALESALEKRKSGERIGEALVRAGVIAEPKLKDVIVKRVEGAVYDALSWIGGEFEFEMTGEGPAQPAQALVQYEDLLPGVNFNTQEVLMDALRVFDERKAGRAPPADAAAPPPAVEPPPESTSSVAIQPPPAVVTASRIIQADRALLIVCGPPTFRDLVRIAVSRLGAELAECSEFADAEARVNAESKRAILVVLQAEGGMLSDLPEGIARLVLAARRIAVLTAGSDPAVAGRAVQAGAFAHVDLLPSDPGPPLSYLPTLAAERLAILASGKATPPPMPPPSSSNGTGEHAEELKHLRTRLDSLTGEVHTQSVSLRIMEFVAERLDRGVLFLVRPNDLQGLGAFGHTADGDPLGPLASGLRLQLEKGSAFRRAIEQRTTLLCELGASPAEKELYARIGSPTPSDALLLPLISVGNVVALVYADNGTSHRDIKDIELLEVLARQAGLVLENALLRKMLNRAT